MRTWVYHKDNAAYIIDSSEYNELFNLGWRDSPGAANAVEFEVMEGQKTVIMPDVVSDVFKTENIEPVEVVPQPEQHKKHHSKKRR